MAENNYKRIIIARTDSIGDVCLTLPMAGALKQAFPEAEIVFLGRNYTLPVIRCCRHVNRAISWDERGEHPTEFLRKQEADLIIHAFPDREVCRAAKDARIDLRIATAGRLHTLFTCNRRVWFSRKRSLLHESQLNFKLLSPIGISEIQNLPEMAELAGWSPPSRSEALAYLTDGIGPKVILHPKSKGSAPEWPLAQYVNLAEMLTSAGARVFVTGTEEESKIIGSAFEHVSGLTNLCGKMSLDAFIGFMTGCNSLVAASTGPLHLAALTGLRSVGLFSPAPPVHPGRWQPIGKNVKIITSEAAPEHGQSLSIAIEKVMLALN
jgi:heptosyltransferase III